MAPGESGSDNPWWDRLAWAAVLPVLLTPISNPDIFWHLSAAEQIISLRALPRSDVFSFTMLGEPWIDFEWLQQLIYYGFHKAAGFPGLLALKALLLAMEAVVVLALFDLQSAPPGVRRAGLLFWAALVMGYFELKPELFSIVLFSLQLWFLEAHRLGGIRTSDPKIWFASALAFYAFWANLHPGFVAGWILLAAYMPGRPRRELAALAAALAAGTAGTCLNPYGTEVFTVLLDHARWMEWMAKHILEWRPPMLSNPFQWPYWLLLASAWTSLAARTWNGRRPPAAQLAAGLAFGVLSLLHARSTMYFAPIGLMLLAAFPPPAVPPGPLRRWGVPGMGLGLYLAFVGRWALPELARGEAFDASLFPVAAGDFIERNLATFRKRRLYNDWGWGGYLAHRFHPELRVFMDGRYIFHPLLPELFAAHVSAGDWQELLDRRGIEWAVMPNRTRPLEVVLQRPGAADRTLRVPHLDVYMPAGKWALVHMDPSARVYVRRQAFPTSWIKTREARRPGNP